MGRMRRKYSQYNPILGGVVDEFHGHMTAMAIKYEKPPFPSSFLLRIPVKYVNQPIKSIFVVRPTRWGSSNMDQIVTFWYIVHLMVVYVTTLSRVDDGGWKR